jgi:microcompartment protein CcmK/EutM
VVSTQKNQYLADNRLLVVQPVDLQLKPIGSSLLALDVVDAGEGDLVLLLKEGGGARIIFQNDRIPLQTVVVGVVDAMDVRPELLQEPWPVGPTKSKEKAS